MPKYLKYLKRNDADKTEIPMSVVEISENDARVLNEAHKGAMTQNGEAILYRKATKEEIAEHQKKLEKLMGGNVEPGTEEADKFQGKTYDEWTLKTLQAFAEEKEIDLEGSDKKSVFIELQTKFKPE